MIKLNTNYELFVDAMNVCYVESNDILLVDGGEGTVEVIGISADHMMQLARNLFCARDSVVNYVTNQETTQRYAKEIVTHLTEYLNNES